MSNQSPICGVLNPWRNNSKKNNQWNLEGAARKGIVEKPSWDLCEPEFVVTSALHSEINTVNNPMQVMFDHTLKRLEELDEEEEPLFKAWMAAEIALDECKEAIKLQNDKMGTTALPTLRPKRKPLKPSWSIFKRPFFPMPKEPEPRARKSVKRSASKGTSLILIFATTSTK